MTQPSSRGLVIGIATIAVLLFAGLVWAVAMAPSEPVSGPREEQVVFSDANNPVKGPADGAVVVRLYGDFQCPACRLAEGGVRYAMEKYGDRVRFIWKDFPLSSIHPQARSAANAARCAEDQQKFWQYHDRLYEVQREWSSLKDPEAAFLSYAEALELNKDQFASCFKDRRFDAKVAADMAEGLRNRVDRTPTFFVNNKRAFAMNPAEWDAVLQSALPKP